MTKFKNVFLLAAMAVSAGFVGCNKEDEGESADGGSKADGSFEIKVTVNTTDITTADSVIFELTKEVNGNVTYVQLAKGTYIEGVLTITLPATVDDKYLSSEPPPEGVTVSGDDPNGKGFNTKGILPIYAYKNGERVGRFGYGDETVEASFLYVYGSGSSGTMKGPSTENGRHYLFDITMKKGWNMLFNYYDDTETHTYHITTTEPSGRNLKWYFNSYNE
ncbi:hypothetical protein AGMMS49982_08270 [Bacteroidia bacterium]|nr:hypothetical protein AGMMS49982_08270 [Bacteroidia bacterium]